MSGEVLLQARDLSRRYGRRWAVRQVSAEFCAGTLTGVIGHNGAGKTTLLALLAGALRPTEGSVHALGHDIHHHPDLPRVRQRLAWLDHRPFVYPELTGLENLSFQAGLYGRDDAPTVLRQRLERVGLGTAADRPVRAYSRGMVQRLAIARILVQDADIWLLDEPGTGLDTAGRALLADILAEARGSGRAIVAVTHDLSVLGPRDALDRVLSLDRGRLTDTVASQPAPAARP